MAELNLGTVNGKKVDQKKIEEFTKTFERDWSDDETVSFKTPWGKLLDALQTIDVPANQITALEQKAASKNVGIDSIVRSALARELVL
ncbi:MAG: hypothetical protein LBM13_00965 [Candidatus Ancillula sp.]|jgi:hypothetical protein|nr:hypothetical protein [Candidatus Ancillula sp.]